MTVDVSKRPERDFELAKQLEAAIRQAGYNEVNVAVSGQFVHIENIANDRDADRIVGLFEAIDKYDKVYAEKRTHDYRVLAEVKAFKYFDPRYAGNEA